MSNKPKVIIVDYKVSNLFSVNQACLHVGLDTEVSSEAKDIEKADALVLPGVGAFGEGMSNLLELDLISPIKEFSSAGKPILGVCLGLQLLFEESEEFGVHRGLGLVEGRVKKIPSQNGTSIRKVPQINWNQIFFKQTNRRGDSLLKGVSDGEYMYFVHSYFVEPLHIENVLTETDYEGFSYCSSIKKNNISAFQFHPEKSGPAGLSIYHNWKISISQKG